MIYAWILGYIFHLQWWLFKSEDNNAQDSMLLHHQTISFVIVLIWETPAEPTYCAFKGYVGSSFGASVILRTQSPFMPICKPYSLDF